MLYNKVGCIFISSDSKPGNETSSTVVQVPPGVVREHEHFSLGNKNFQICPLKAKNRNRENDMNRV